MSRTASDWTYRVFEALPCLSANRRHLLMVLAHCHNGETGQCNPSLSYLVKLTGLNRHTIPAAIVDLEAFGLITVHRRDGACSHYTLHLESLGNPEAATPKRYKNLTGAKDSTSAKNDHSGAKTRQEPVRFLAPEQGIEQGKKGILFTGARSEPLEAAGPVDATPIRRGQLSALLRKAGVNITPSHPDLCQWVNSEVTDAEALESIERARRCIPAPELIPANYLAKIVPKVISERAARLKPCPAATTAPGQFRSIHPNRGSHHDKPNKSQQRASINAFLRHVANPGGIVELTQAEYERHRDAVSADGGVLREPVDCAVPG